MTKTQEANLIIKTYKNNILPKITGETYKEAADETKLLNFIKYLKYLEDKKVIGAVLRNVTETRFLAVY